MYLQRILELSLKLLRWPLVGLVWVLIFTYWIEPYARQKLGRKYGIRIEKTSDGIRGKITIYHWVYFGTMNPPNSALKQWDVFFNRIMPLINFLLILGFMLAFCYSFN
jgi:hypothetical protein